jgi:DNA ligase (NAD+)
MLKRAVEHFASRGALDIDGLGEKNVIALVDAGLVNDLADIYAITKEQLLQIERFAELSADNLIKAIADKKTPPLARFLFGLGIRHVGAQTAIDLATTFKRLDTIGSASYEDLRAVNGVGAIVADSIVLWFDESDNQDVLAKFRRLGVWPIDVEHVGGPLSGKSFVITGSLQSMGRDMAAEKIRALGGTFQTSVAKGTTYLVMGEKAGQSKADKARKLGTNVIDEQELISILDKI